jgi:hypothetical protein
VRPSSICFLNNIISERSDGNVNMFNGLVFIQWNIIHTVDERAWQSLLYSSHLDSSFYTHTHLFFNFSFQFLRAQVRTRASKTVSLHYTNVSVVWEASD